LADSRHRLASCANPQARISTPARQILTGEAFMTEPKAAPCSPLSIIFSSLSIISSSIPLEADRAHVLIPAEVDVLYFSVRIPEGGGGFKIDRSCLVRERLHYAPRRKERRSVDVVRDCHNKRQSLSCRSNDGRSA
jgi:hypothetical protein